MQEFKQPERKYYSKIRYWMPEGMVNLEDLRKDVADIDERGFSSIEVVSFMPLGDKEVEADKKWGSQAWIKAIQTILDEAQKRNLKIDLANGPAWPIAMPNIQNADDKASLYELTYGLKTGKEMLEDNTLPQPKMKRESGTTTLVALMKYQSEDKVLDETTYEDLMPHLKGNRIIYDFNEKDVIFAFYGQPSCQKVSGSYAIDHLSKEGSEACKDYWLKEIYPSIQKYQGTLQSIFCDSLEFNVALEWTRGLENIFKELKRYDIRPYLPVLGKEKTYPKHDVCGYSFKNQTLENAVCNDFKDVISHLYNVNHLQMLEQIAHQMEMTIRYQVAYNKPFEIESAATSVSIPEGEALSRPTIDNLKTMAGAKHKLGKEKYSYECSAEFGHGYDQGHGDIWWWIKRSYCAGMNDQVFHGGTYLGKYKDLPWPYYETFLKEISNYWNRTLDKVGQKRVLTAIARANYLLQKPNKIDLAIYRHDYLNDGKGSDGNHLLKDDLLLTKKGYTYDLVNSYLLDQKEVLERTGYRALIIQNQTSLSSNQVQRLIHASNLGLPIYIVGKLNRVPFFKKDKDLDYYDELENKATHVKDYKDLIKQLNQDRIEPRAKYLNDELIYSMMSYDDNHTYYYFYNANPVKGSWKEDKFVFDPATYYPLIDRKQFKKKVLDVQLEGEGDPVLFDLASGNLYKLDYQKYGNKVHISLNLFEDEAIFIGLVPQNEYDQISEFDLKHQYSYQYDQSISLHQTMSKEIKLNDHVKRFDDYHLEATLKQDQPGYHVYQSEFTIDQQANYLLEIGYIKDTYRVYIDGKEYLSCGEEHPYFVLENLDVGKHDLKIELYTTFRGYFKEDQTCKVENVCLYVCKDA